MLLYNYTLSLSIKSLDKTFNYENKLFYSYLKYMKNVLDLIESRYKDYPVTYQVSTPIFDYVYREDMYIDAPFNITAMYYKFSYTGWLFVDIKKDSKDLWIKCV